MTPDITNYMYTETHGLAMKLIITSNHISFTGHNKYSFEWMTNRNETNIDFL